MVYGLSVYLVRTVSASTFAGTSVSVSRCRIGLNTSIKGDGASRRRARRGAVGGFEPTNFLVSTV